MSDRAAVQRRDGDITIRAGIYPSRAATQDAAVNGETGSMTRYARGLRLLPAFALVLTLIHPRDAAAAFDNMIDTLKEMIADFVYDLSPSFFTGSTVVSVTKITPKALIHDMTTNSHFMQHLSDAGYQLVEVDMSVGLIPDVKMTYQMVRELSEADRTALERSLEIDDKRVPGVKGIAERQIVRTLLAVSKSEEMRVGKLVIGILPLPSAEFTIEPAEVPLGEEHNALLQAIRGKATEGKPNAHGVRSKQ